MFPENDYDKKSLLPVILIWIEIFLLDFKNGDINDWIYYYRLLNRWNLESNINLINNKVTTATFSTSSNNEFHPAG